jgi:hypothetical protein
MEFERKRSIVRVLWDGLDRKMAGTTLLLEVHTAVK